MQTADKQNPTSDPMTDLDRLRAWLKRHAPQNILMPLRHKRPRERHMKGAWSWEKYDTVHPANPVGILLKTLLCIDIDSRALYEYLLREHPEWFSAPHIKASTSKGYHLIWLRTEYCDELNVTDKARMLGPACVPEELLDVNGQVPLDIKTITSTGTGGVLVVAPSPDKEWLTPPWAVDSGTKPLSSGTDSGSVLSSPSPVPDALIDWLDANKKRRTSRRREAGAVLSSQAVALEEYSVNDVSNPSCDADAPWTLPIDMSIGVAVAYEALHALGDNDSYFYQQRGNSLYFKTKASRHCPYGKVHHSNNCYLNFDNRGNIKYFCFGSACQDQYAQDPKVIGRWAEEERAEVSNRFELKHYNVYARQWDKLMQPKPRDRDHGRLAELAEVLVEYINRFFIIALHKKPEIVQLEYEQEGKHVVNFVRRSAKSHWETYTHTFMKTVWYQHDDRREVDRLKFELDPAAVGPREFNMFLGLKVERDSNSQHNQQSLCSSTGDLYEESRTALKDKIAPILTLLHDVWANGNDAIYQYLLNWFAYPLQRKCKTGVCVVVISEQGYGKGTVAHDLVGCGIYGEVKNDTQSGNYTQITDIDDIVGRFNSQSCGRIFINADECSSYSAAYRMNNKFKSLITATSRKLESKGVDGVTVSDHTNYLMTTNNSRPIKVEPSDRRFVVLEIDHARKKSAAFFKKLHGCIKEGGPMHFYQFLMARKLPADFDPQAHRPVTAAARAMMKEQVPLHIRFIQECADAEMLPAECSLVGDRQPWKRALHIPLEDLYAGYVDWAKKRQAEHITNDVHFSSDLAKYTGIQNGKRTNKGATKDLPSPEQVRLNLQEAKLYFD